jgi:Outer membrane protein and related peptidoglycan-associated (lipo)proteins
MKTLNPKAATALSLTLLLSASSAMAADKKMSEETKAGLIGATWATTAAVAGAAVAGPVGLFIGAVSGIYVGEKGIAAAKTKVELDNAENSLASLEYEMNAQNKKITQLERHATDTLEFMVFFPTGIDDLSHSDKQRIHSLSNYLRDNPSLNVRLNGHADPRGTDEYNNVLSEERTLSVVKLLNERGVEKDRIQYQAHGSSLSQSFDNNMDAYAMERKVRIEVYSPGQHQEVAANQ